MNNIFYDVDDMSSWRVPNPKQLSKEQAKQLQRELNVNDDGIVGKDTITALQRRLGVDADGKWGKKSTQAWIDEYNDEAQERFNYNRAKEQGKVNPAVVDLFAPVSSKSIKEEEPYTNIEVDNAELAELEAEIAKVKQQIADKQANYEEVPLPKTRVGWSSYIANNDRGLLDKYQDAERAWYNAKKQSEYAQKLADKQRAEQADYNRDEWQLNLSKAQNELIAANEALRIANKNGDEESINTATQAATNAKANVDYWSKRLGVESTTNVYTPKNNGPEGGNDELRSAESIIATAKTEFKKKLTQAEIDAQIRALTPYASQNGEAATLISDYKGKKSSESIDFDNAVLKEAKKGNEGIWDLLDKDVQQTLMNEARAKLSKGAK